MKSLIVKTALITLGITILCSAALFGIVSFAAPSAMMDLALSIGLESVAGDYAYQKYLSSNEVEYLARAFEISAGKGNDAVASARFTILYGEDGSEARARFDAYCEGYVLPDTAGVPEDYRSYLCAQAARVNYRLAESGEEKQKVLRFALAETGDSFVKGNPMIALGAECASRSDPFAAEVLSALEEDARAGAWNTNNAKDYQSIIKILKRTTEEL